MAEIVNLRTARKRKARAERDARAAENRVRFGQTKAARRLDAARRDKEVREHESHRLKPGDDQ